MYLHICIRIRPPLCRVWLVRADVSVGESVPVPVSVSIFVRVRVAPARLSLLASFSSPTQARGSVPKVCFAAASSRIFCRAGEGFAFSS